MKSRLAIAAALWLLTSSGLNLHSAERAANLQEPAAVIQAYMRAILARDFTEAYRFISAADRRVRDVNRYAQQRGALNGFALQAARSLSGYVEIDASQKTVAPNRIEARARYKAPDPDKMRALLLNWNAYELNSLTAAERKQLIESIEAKHRDGTLAMTAGEEQLELVKEGSEWRVFLNWAAGIRISLQPALPEASGVEVSVSKNQMVVQPGDVFEVSLRIKNRSKEPISARIGHLIQPRELESFLDFVECGFLVPVTLEAEKEQEYSSRYLLRETIPEGIRQLNLTYDFRLRRLLRPQ
ncbi:MAG TPA: cytochrome c oxidase assembly protein [Candidatus Binatia bacterium]|nr:cytochrome c oxidase assembly protein [Candidatus Binatia bacterium]